MSTSREDLPLPEAVTVGSDARLLGGCFSVLVGLAETTERAARAEKMIDVFMMIVDEENYSTAGTR